MDAVVVPAGPSAGGSGKTPAGGGGWGGGGKRGLGVGDDHTPSVRKGLVVTDRKIDLFSACGLMIHMMLSVFCCIDHAVYFAGRAALVCPRLRDAKRGVTLKSVGFFL